MYNTGNLVKELVERHGRKRDSLMPILQDIVGRHNYLTDEAMVEVAKELDISAAEVYGTASFYSFLIYSILFYSLIFYFLLYFKVIKIFIYFICIFNFISSFRKYVMIKPAQSSKNSGWDYANPY